MNKEEFRLSIINEVSSNLQAVLLMMIETNPFYRFTDGNYRKQVTCFHKDFNQKIIFSCSTDVANIPHVSVLFEEVEPGFRWEEINQNDLSKSQFNPSVFVQEKIRFDQAKIYLSIEFYKIKYKNYSFQKEDEKMEMSIIFDTESRTFNLNVEQFEEYIRTYRNDGDTYAYLDIYFDFNQIREVEVGLQDCEMTLSEKATFLRILNDIHVNRHFSPLDRIIAFMKKELKGS